MSTPSVSTFFKPVNSPAKADSADTEAGGEAAAPAAAASPASSRPSRAKAKAAAPASPKPVRETAASRKRKSMEAAAAAAAEEGDAAEKKEGDAPAAPAAPAATAAAAGDDGDAKRAKAEAALSTLVHPSWARVLSAEFSKPYWGEIESFLRAQAKAKVQVFPAREHIFRALSLCPFEQTRVVILGQDPYHDVGQAEGMCFSVPHGVKVPSSLQNIYKELASDLGAAHFKKPSHGHLSKWAEQGVLLLNTGLTVKAHEANSHKKVGWAKFTTAVIAAINRELKGVVFLLWGKHAQDAAKGVDESKHHVLKTVHPSGLSASRGFFGCKHFSKTNALLTKQGGKPIDWQV